jgi:uncharacterized coiled-coil protein SlyX
MKEVTLDNITNEDILQMARYIEQLEQVNKDQAGYILQLQTQLTNLGKRFKQLQQTQGSDTIATFVEVKGELEL